MAQAAEPGQTNGFDKDVLKAFVDQIDGLKDEISSTMGTAMRECKGYRDDIRDVYASAKDKGIPIKALKAEVALRDLDRQKAKIIAGLEDDDEQSLEKIQEALGDFASSPLGEAVLKEARQRANPN